MIGERIGTFLVGAIAVAVIISVLRGIGWFVAKHNGHDPDDPWDNTPAVLKTLVLCLVGAVVVVMFGAVCAITYVIGMGIMLEVR